MNQSKPSRFDFIRKVAATVFENASTGGVLTELAVADITKSVTHLAHTLPAECFGDTAPSHKTTTKLPPLPTVDTSAVFASHNLSARLEQASASIAKIEAALGIKAVPGSTIDFRCVDAANKIDWFRKELLDTQSRLADETDAWARRVRDYDIDISSLRDQLRKLNEVVPVIPRKLVSQADEAGDILAQACEVALAKMPEPAEVVPELTAQQIRLEEAAAFLRFQDEMDRRMLEARAPLGHGDDNYSMGSGAW